MAVTQTPPQAPPVGDMFGPALATLQAQLAGLVDVPAWSLDDKRLGDRFAQALACGQVTGEQAVVVASAVNRLSADVGPVRDPQRDVRDAHQSR